MSAFTAHLIRRGIDEFQGRSEVTAATPQGGEKLDILPWAGLLILITILAFTFGLFAIQYTYGEVVATLAAIEAPSTTAIVCTSEQVDNAEPDAPLLDLDQKQQPPPSYDQEILLINQRPLTSRFCTIKRHLKARGGPGARFRGLHIYIFNAILSNLVLGFFSSFSIFKRSILMLTVAEILTATLLTRFSLLWNHIVISEPSTRSWVRRFVPYSTFIKALAPTAIAATISKLSAVPFLHASIALTNFKVPVSAGNDNNPALQDLLSLGTVALLGFAIVLGVQIPAEIAINRVRASLLASDEEPIVPFDRTFNGQVRPTSEGGTGILGLWKAWAGCDMQTRLRVLGVYLKVMALQIALMLFGVLTVSGELRLLLGPDYLQKIGSLVVNGGVVF